MHLPIYLGFTWKCPRSNLGRTVNCEVRLSSVVFDTKLKGAARLLMKRLLEKLAVHVSLSFLLVALFGLTVTTSAQNFTVNNLTADVPGIVANTDHNLIGPVGLSRGIIGKWWVPNSGSATATLYDGNGV